MSPLVLFLVGQAVSPVDVGQVANLRPIVNRPAGSAHNVTATPSLFAAWQVSRRAPGVRPIANQPALFDIIDRIAVSIGYHVVTTTDLDREIRVTAFLNDTKPDFSPTSKRAAADRMVEQTLVRTELETSRYPTPPPSEVDPILAQLKKRFPNDAAFQRALADYGITEQYVRDELLWQRTLLSFLDVRFRPSVEVSDKDMEDYFNKTIKPTAPAANFDDYRDQIEEKLTGDREDQEMSRWLDQAKKRTEIVYHNDAL